MSQFKLSFEDITVHVSSSNPLESNYQIQIFNGFDSSAALTAIDSTSTQASNSVYLISFPNVELDLPIYQLCDGSHFNISIIKHHSTTEFASSKVPVVEVCHHKLYKKFKLFVYYDENAGTYPPNQNEDNFISFYMGFHGAIIDDSKNNSYLWLKDFYLDKQFLVDPILNTQLDDAQVKLCEVRRSEVLGRSVSSENPLSEIVIDVRSDVVLIHKRRLKKSREMHDPLVSLDIDSKDIRGRIIVTNLRLIFMPFRNHMESIVFKLFDFLDLDASGGVSLKELEEAFEEESTVGSDSQTTSTATEGHEAMKLVRAFQAMDTDGDGSLTIDEILTALTKTSGVNTKSLENAINAPHHSISIPLWNIEVIEDDTENSSDFESVNAGAISRLSSRTVNISVPNFQFDLETSSIFYIVEVAVESENWSVYHRYSEFLKLHAHLSSIITDGATIIPTLPPRDSIGSMFKRSERFNETRRAGLESYLKAVVLISAVWQDSQFCHFIDGTPELDHLHAVIEEITIYSQSRQKSVETTTDSNSVVASQNHTRHEEHNAPAGIINELARIAHASGKVTTNGEKSNKSDMAVAPSTRSLKITTKDRRQIFFYVSQHTNKQMNAAGKGALSIRGVSGDHLTSEVWVHRLRSEVFRRQRKDCFAYDVAHSYANYLCNESSIVTNQESPSKAAIQTLFEESTSPSPWKTSIKSSFSQEATLSGHNNSFSKIISQRFVDPTENALLGEYYRFGVVTDKYDPTSADARENLWRITDFNRSHEFIASYPTKLGVPKVVADEILKIAVNDRSKGRIAALTWLHPTTKAPLCRSSQPKSGMFSTTLAADDQLLMAIRDCALNPKATLYIIDARPEINARANALMGNGVEDEKRLGNAHLIYMGIENIHEMRHSLDALSEAVSSSYFGNYLSTLQSSNWLHHLEKILRAATFMTTLLQSGEPVLVHCSDGWDRTSQLSSITQILLDPYYRTIKGFEVLVEKDWVSFGHKFYDRTNGGGSNVKEASPIFLQFLDVVYQLTRQFPTAFEFNEVFLLAVANALYSRYFTTFLCNNEVGREIKLHKLAQKLGTFGTSGSDNLSNNPPVLSSESIPLLRIPNEITLHGVSLWAYLRDMYAHELLANILYVAPAMLDTNSNIRVVEPLKPVLDVRALVLWEKMYCHNGQSFYANASEQNLLRNKLFHLLH